MLPAGAVNRKAVVRCGAPKHQHVRLLVARRTEISVALDTPHDRILLLTAACAVTYNNNHNNHNNKHSRRYLATTDIHHIDKTHQ